MVIREDNYNEAWSIALYAIEEANNQRQILSYINECVCIESGNISGIMPIHESLIDGVSNFIKRVIEFVKKAFAKFTERVGELFTTDKAYLEKHKNTILKNNFKNHILNDFWNYDIGKFNEIIKMYPPKDTNTVSKLYDHFKNDENAKYDETTFISQELEALAKEPVNKNVTSVEDVISNVIKGADSLDDFDMTRLNTKKQSMFDWCYNWNGTHNQLKNNSAIINSNCNKVQGIINKLSQELKDKATNESTYSKVLGRVISEDVKVEKSSNGTTSGTSSTSSSTHGSQINKVTGQDIESNNKTAEQIKAGNDKDGNADPNAGDTESRSKIAEKMATACETWLKCTVEIYSTQLNLGLAIYKDYMKLLRIHVRDYVSDEDPDKNNAASDDNSTTQDVTVRGENGELSFKYASNDAKVKSEVESIKDQLENAGEDFIKEINSIDGYKNRKGLIFISKNPVDDDNHYRVYTNMTGAWKTILVKKKVGVKANKK